MKDSSGSASADGAFDGEFDADWYARSFPDVAESGLSPVDHFHRIGRRLGRPGSPLAQGAEVSPQWAVDIIVPVFNALTDTVKCLHSIVHHGSESALHLILVDDGSDAPTRDWLAGFAARKHDTGISVTLIRKEQNEGYTRAINSGLAHARGNFVVTQNSDTIVTEGWLEKMIACMTSDATTGIVGPLSNAASWQNVPALRDAKGDFAINALPEGMTPDGMARLVEQASGRLYPSVNFVNGFCFMLSRKLLDRIGTLDEVAFPIGYGEENDLCIRALDAGYTLRIADDAYVHHAKSRSFGHANRQSLSQSGAAALRQKHGNDRVNALLNEMKSHAGLATVRDRVGSALDDHLATLCIRQQEWLLGQKLLFVLPVNGGGGGSHSILQEAAAMMAMGLHVRVAVRQGQVANFLRLYADIDGIADLLLPFTDPLLPQIFKIFDVVIATLYSSVDLIRRSMPAECRPEIAYYAQDYEPLFFEPGSDRREEASASYTLIPGTAIFAKTDWILGQIAEHHAVAGHRVTASVDHAVYFPQANQFARGNGPLRISAMLRPSTPYRGAERTLRLFERLKQKFGERIALTGFGCPKDDTLVAPGAQRAGVELRGVLTRAEVAEVLRKTDIFIDLSDYQAFGRTGIEAMACGAALVSTRHGGPHEYACHDGNAVLVDPFDEDAVFASLCDLVSDPERLSALRLEGLKTPCIYTPTRAALSEMSVLSRHVAANRSRLSPAGRQRVCVVPCVSTEALDRVSYTGSAFVRLINPYFALEGPEFSVTFSQSGRLPAPGSADVVVFQRDLAASGQREFATWAAQWKAHGGRIIYDIDDDLLDGDALVSRGYADDVARLAERVRAYAGQADLVAASTDRLVELMSPLAKAVTLVPNHIDAGIWGLARPAPARKPGTVRIGYFGTPTHDADLAMIAEPIRRIEREFGARVEIIGAFQHSKPLFGHRIPLPQNSIYPVFCTWLRTVAQWDITLIPLADSSFNRAKSNLKFTESSALGGAIVCSDAEEYRKLARHRQNALVVANSPDAWYLALRDLILDPGLRRNLAGRAWTDLIERGTVQANRSLYQSVIRRVLSV